MNTIIVDAHAKINLSLDVVGKRENGYHELSMIMQEISLKDIITIRELDDNKDRIDISSNRREVPRDSKNIVHRAATLLKEKFKVDRSIEIHIEKNIPISAGLAGGSTDAAAVLVGLNKIWKLELTQNELMKLGVEIGADVPFCIMGGTALSEGIGEILTPLTPFKDRWILLANPGTGVSTKEVYEALDLKNLKERPDIEQMISYLEEGDTERLASQMKNVLESVTTRTHPEIEEIKTQIKSCGALGSLMSGSGATVFGIFEDRAEMELCKTRLEKNIETVILAKTI